MNEKASQMASGIKRVQKDFTLALKLAVLDQEKNAVGRA
jgi:hypothetical protein